MSIRTPIQDALGERNYVKVREALAGLEEEFDEDSVEEGYLLGVVDAYLSLLESRQNDEDALLARIAIEEQIERGVGLRAFEERLLDVGEL